VRLRRRALAGLLVALAARAGAIEIERSDPRFDALVPRDARVEKLVGGMSWVEGPVWEPRLGALLFSDVVRNAVFAWEPGAGVREFLRPSGFSGSAPFPGREPGANGLVLDPEGRLVLCEHGDRRVTRLEADGTRTVLADRYQGKRLNSPNDAVFDRRGELHFTDPPFGLPGTFDDPAKELLESRERMMRRSGRPRPQPVALPLHRAGISRSLAPPRAAQPVSATVVDLGRSRGAGTRTRRVIRVTARRIRRSTFAGVAAR
jgi:hypothetical protein